MTTGDWRTRFAELDSLSSESDANARRQRGKAFERVLHEMFEEAGMEPRASFRPAGEEIDGSFIYRGRPMLLEAKWTSDPVPASTLYAFHGKLAGKLAGTLGVFISMSGFSPDAVDALVLGKSLDIILFDGNDVRLLARGDGLNIETAINLKLRAAAEKGTVYLTLSEQDVPLPPETGAPPPELVVVVEDAYDVAFMQQLLAAHGTEASAMFVPAGGPRNLPLVALAQRSMRADTERVIVVADGKGAPSEVRRQLEIAMAELGSSTEERFELIVFDTDLEAAFNLRDPDSGQRVPQRRLRRAVELLDLRRLSNENNEVARLLRLLKVGGRAGSGQNVS